MSMNLSYHDLWHDLYDYAVKHNKDLANLMEAMDPRLEEENRVVEQVVEAVKTFLKP